MAKEQAASTGEPQLQGQAPAKCHPTGMPAPGRQTGELGRLPPPYETPSIPPKEPPGHRQVWKTIGALLAEGTAPIVPSCWYVHASPGLKVSPVPKGAEANCPQGADCWGHVKGTAWPKARAARFHSGETSYSRQLSLFVQAGGDGVSGALCPRQSTQSNGTPVRPSPPQPPAAQVPRTETPVTRISSPVPAASWAVPSPGKALGRVQIPSARKLLEEPQMILQGTRRGKRA